MGDNFEFLCRLAKSQGTKVILFLDGDKRKLIEQQKVAAEHPDVKIIFLPDREEFEQLLPTEVYFRAVAEATQQPDATVAIEAWKRWVNEDPRHEKKSFSKQVWSWLEESIDTLQASKPAVMRRAVELAKPEEIRADPLRQLLKAISDDLAGTSF